MSRLCALWHSLSQSSSRGHFSHAFHFNQCVTNNHDSSQPEHGRPTATACNAATTKATAITATAAAAASTTAAAAAAQRRRAPAQCDALPRRRRAALPEACVLGARHRWQPGG